MPHPDAAFAVLAAGIAGCLWEAVQPGRIVPGVAGLGAAVLGTYWLARNQPDGIGLACIAFSILILAAGAFMRHPLVFGAVATGSMSTGFLLLFPEPLRITPLLAVPVCAVLSFAALWLLRMARIARLRKRL
jgi:membrane-bound serine protease (ClpP class)